MVFNMTLMIIGLVKNAERVIEPRINDLVPLVCTPGWHVSLKILEGGSTDNTRSILKKLQQSPPNCGITEETSFNEFEIMDEPGVDEFDSIETMVTKARQCDANLPPLGPEDLRILRISRLRDFMRNQLRVSVVNTGTTSRNVVLLVDFDLEKFPDIVLLRAHIWRVAHSKSQFQAICANGKTAYRLRIWKGLKYYDVFATVLQNGSYPFQVITNPKTPATERDQLVKTLTREIDEAASLIYPVQSCFGGMAAYQTEFYFDRRCNYTSELTRTNKHSVYMPEQKSVGFPCEHVSFHTCLARVRNLAEGQQPFAIGIAKNLIPYWLPAGQAP